MWPRAVRVIMPMISPPVAPLVAPSALPSALTLAASAWSLAFLLYLFQYGPWLLRTRADGKDG